METNCVDTASSVTYFDNARPASTTITMVRAWFMDDSSEDQRQPHMTDPPQFVSLDDLKTLGVLYFEVGYG